METPAEAYPERTAQTFLDPVEAVPDNQFCPALSKE
jgi:hypothetical protein